MKPLIRTYTGKVICPLALSPSDIEIKDIAKSLSNTCRFGGHLEDFYSTAEHSVLCWQASLGLTKDPKVQMACLIHDGCEGLTAIDHVKPCKANYAVALPPNGEIVTIGELENRISKVMLEGLDLPIDLSHPLVKQIDKMMVNAESLKLRGYLIHENVATLNVTINCWEPKKAYKEFLLAFQKARCIL